MITSSTRQLANPARLNYMRTTTAERLETATTHLHNVKALSEVGHTIVDQAKKQATNALDPDKETAGAAG